LRMAFDFLGIPGAPCQFKWRGEEEDRGEEGHDSRFNALSRASQVHSRENPRDSTKPEQRAFQAGDNVR
jgi:hypothetical protein